MKKWIFFLIIPFTLFSEATFFNHLKLFHARPDIFLVVTVIIALIFDLGWAFSLGLFAGFCKDIFCAHAYGLNTLLLPFWVFLIVKLSRKITLDHDLARAVLVFVVAALNAVAFRLIYFYAAGAIPWGVFLRIAILGPLYTACISYFIFKTFHPALES